jgi:hypothetical protein
VLRTREVGPFVGDPHVFEYFGQTLSLFLITCKESILSVQLHLTGRKHFRFLNLSTTQLDGGLSRSGLSWRNSCSSTLCLVDLLGLSSRLVNSRTVLLRDLTLHHIHAVAFQFLPDSLLALKLGLLCTTFHHRFSFSCGVLDFILSLHSGNNTRFVNIVKRVIKNVVVQTILVGRLF